MTAGLNFLLRNPYHLTHCFTKWLVASANFRKIEYLSVGFYLFKNTEEFR